MIQLLQRPLNPTAATLAKVPFLLLGLAISLPFALAGEPADGATLAAELRNQRPAERIETSGTLKIRTATGRKTEIPVRMETTSAGPTWTVTYASSETPDSSPEMLQVVHREGATSAYYYTKANRGEALPSTPTPVSTPQLTRPFAGTDFWLCDLGLEFLHWPNQRLVKNEMRKGRSCRVLESTPDSSYPTEYSRVLSWIDIESGGLLRAEAYDRDHKLLKEFSVRSFQRVSKAWQLKEIEIRNERTDTRTRLEFNLELQDREPQTPLTGK
jgi:hypothetical protein